MPFSQNEETDLHRSVERFTLVAQPVRCLVGFCQELDTHRPRSKFQKENEWWKTQSSFTHYQTFLQKEGDRGKSFWLPQQCQQCQEFIWFSHESNASTLMHNKQRREVLSTHRRASRHCIFIFPRRFSIFLFSLSFSPGIYIHHLGFLIHQDTTKSSSYCIFRGKKTNLKQCPVIQRVPHFTHHSPWL